MPSRPLKVFLCRAHADRDSVRTLYSRLTNGGVDAWLDKERLLPGQDWELKIRKAVREADVVVVCLSKQFNQAGYRQKEVRWALETAMEQPEGEIFINPARLEECDTLESLRKWHWVDLFEDDGYKMLMRALRARADKIGASVKITFGKKAPRINPTNPADPKAVPYYLRKFDVEEREKLPTNIATPIIEPKVDHPITSSKIKFPKIRIEILVAIIGAVATIVAGLLSSPLIEKWVGGNTVLTSTPDIMVAMTKTAEFRYSIFILVAEATFTPTFTSTPAFMTPTSTPLPTEITVDKGVQMVLVPAGEFTMGSMSGNANEQPVHKVYLDSFYMDKYEVTNALYKACVNDRACTLPSSSYTIPGYFSNSEYDNYPVVNVDWKMARIYCDWRGAQLPTEAQWEKAARGTDGRTYPWGEKIDCSKVNYCEGGPTKVGSYESGKSPYGIYDMAGNVWEWVADWYLETYYQNSPAFNPLGLDNGQDRVMRGGSYGYVEEGQRVTNRGPEKPDFFVVSLGFRCSQLP